MNRSTFFGKKVDLFLVCSRIYYKFGFDHWSDDMQNLTSNINLISQNSIKDLFRIDHESERSLMILPSPIETDEYAIGVKGKDGISYMSGAFARSNSIREFKTVDSALKVIRRIGIDVSSIILLLNRQVEKDID